jgi:hypothetical protein
VFVVVLAGLQAVVELAEEPVEQVSLGLVFPISGGAANVVVRRAVLFVRRPAPGNHRHHLAADPSGTDPWLPRPVTHPY